MSRLGRRSLALAFVALPGLVVLVAPAVAQNPDPVPVDGTGPVVVGDDLAGAVGLLDVVVQLSTPPLADVVPAEATAAGGLPTGSDQHAHLAVVAAEQAAVAPTLAGVGATERARLDTGLNAVVVSVDASQIEAVAAIPGVKSVRRVRDYTMFQEPAVGSGTLAQAAQYLGADAVRDDGFDGTGVRVAVLDSGIDFTHANLGGPGAPTSYASCFGVFPNPAATPPVPAPEDNPANFAPTGECADFFGPEAPKVKGGFDFIGDNWASGEVHVPDPNPIDFEGHGTHVADIIGGRSGDGTHLGMAPGVELYGLKVCSSISTACSGVALLQAVEWALDPNGDGDIVDAVDVMNLSLGADYGQVHDDLTEALTNAAEVGVVVVTSAGNGADRPYKVGSPSVSPQVLSVAQTAMPDDRWVPIVIGSPVVVPGFSENTIKNSVEQPWAPPFEQALTAPADRPDVITGCDLRAYGTGFTPGAIAVVQRGLSAASLKSDAARQAGASAVIIVNNAGGLAPTFSFGGGAPIRTLATNQPFGNELIKAVTTGSVTLTIDPANAIPLQGTMVGSSSRGPTIDGSLVKPDIGAPGAWLSAEVGTGTGNTTFGGTSGAAPTVAGSAALLLAKFAGFPPSRVTAMLVNNGELGNRTPTVDGNFSLTPISRIGGGEVRVDQAADTGLVARGRTGTIGLSFGAVDTAGTKVLTRTVMLHNLESVRKTYSISTSYRSEDDAATGAVALAAPGEVEVPPLGTTEFTLTMVIDPNRLPAWPLAGKAGTSGDGTMLSQPEYDGFITLTSGDDVVNVPWHVLPRKASALRIADAVRLNRHGTAQLKVGNLSVAGDGSIDVFGLTGTSDERPRLGPAETDAPGASDGDIDLAAVGARNDSDVVQFAIATFGRRAVPLYPAAFVIEVDTTGDGQVDWVIFNAKSNGAGATDQDVVFVQRPGATTARGFFMSSTDFNSGTTIFTVPLAALGLSEGSTLNFDVTAIDNYLTGLVNDAIDDNIYTVDAPKYVMVEGSSLPVPHSTGARFTVQATGSPAPSSETGLLLLKSADALGDFDTVSVSGGVVPFAIPAG